MMKRFLGIVGVLLILISAFLSVSAEQCSDIYIDSSAVRVERGERAFETFYLINQAEENFIIEYLSVFDTNESFKAEEHGYEKVVEPGKPAAVNVSVEAYEGAELGRSYAFLDVKGHFQSGKECYFGAESLGVFPVIIEEKQETKEFEGEGGIVGVCGMVSVIAPASQEIGERDAVHIAIDNRAYSRIVVRLGGAGITADPGLISVPKRSFVQESIVVSSKLPETGLVYEIDAPGCKAEEHTVITFAAAGGPGEAQGEGKGEEQEQGIIVGIATGFAALGQNSFAIGLVLLIAVILFFILKE